MLDKTIGFIILIPIIIALIWNVYGYYLEKYSLYIIYAYKYTHCESNYFIYQKFHNEKRLIKHIYKESYYNTMTTLEFKYNIELKDKQIINMIETDRHISVSDVFDIMVIDYVNKHLKYG